MPEGGYAGIFVRRKINNKQEKEDDYAGIWITFFRVGEGQKVNE